MTPSQREAFDTQFDRLGRHLADGTLDFDTVFPGCTRRVLEIGFGMGYTLAELAAREPATAFVGVEVHRPGVGKLLDLATKAEIANLRVYCEDALQVLDVAIAPASLDAVLLFFPDPWPKTRHHKRRIVQPAFVDTVRSRLRAGGVFHLATDVDDYARHMLEVLEAAAGWENLAGAGRYAERPASRPQTRFEARGLRLGHSVHDLLYRRIG